MEENTRRWYIPKLVPPPSATRSDDTAAILKLFCSVWMCQSIHTQTDTYIHNTSTTVTTIKHTRIQQRHTHTTTSHSRIPLTQSQITRGSDPLPDALPDSLNVNSSLVLTNLCCGERWTGGIKPYSFYTKILCLLTLYYHKYTNRRMIMIICTVWSSTFAYF